MRNCITYAKQKSAPEYYGKFYLNTLGHTITIDYNNEKEKSSTFLINAL